MGGGEAMRTAAKLAGIGFGRTGFRGAPTAHPAEHYVRNVYRQASATISSEGLNPAGMAPLHASASWELDDWELEDGGYLVMAAGEPMPRVVFGGVPTFEEAKEATAELKEAIDKIYFSSDSSECEEPSPGSQVSVLSRTHVEPETKSFDIEAISNPSATKHAVQAFQLLSTSPQVQTVVASIARDPNVWNAVMQSPAVHDFLQSHQRGAPEIVEEFANCDAVAGSKAKETPEEVKELLVSHLENASFYFMGFMENIKLTVAEMVRKVSNYFQNIFPTAEKEKSDADGNSNANFMDGYMGRTFMGLASLVIMAVVVKRLAIMAVVLKRFA